MVPGHMVTIRAPGMLPPSAAYLATYVGEAEEAALVGAIDKAQWRDDLRRRVQHCGFRYDYKARRVTGDSYLGPLPGWLAPIARRLREDELFDDVPDQVIVNEYLPGRGLPATSTASRVSAIRSPRSA